MPNDLHVVSIIPARGGSKGIPRKNVRVVGGKPLVAWSVEASLKCALIDRTIVSTDDEEIAGVAREYGAEVPFMRPAELAADRAGTEGVLQHAVDWLEQKDGYRVDILVFLQPTDIFRKQSWVGEVVQALMDDPGLESCFVGYETYKNFWQVRDGAFVPLSHRGYGPRQTKSSVIREDTGLACASRAEVIKAGKRVGDRVKIILTDEFACGIDVQYPFDLFLAEKVITEWGLKPNWD